MMALTDYLSEQVLEVVAQSIKNKFQYHQLIDAVQKIEREYKQAEFEYLSQQEEFDWDGLKQYIEDHLLTNISSVFLSPNQDIRKALRKQVYICAYSSAQANTVAKQRQVDRLMDKVLIQVRSFLCEQQEPMDLMPFNEVTDQICVSLDTWGEEIKTIIQQQTQQIEKQFEHLQESLQYQHSFAKSVDHLKLPQPIHSLFHYRDPQIGFYGREKEITYLDRFLDCEDPILFTAVNGPAGAGKSKFLYEYMKGLASNPKWKCLFLQSKKIIEKFLALGEWDYPENLLVVIDYAGDYAELIGEWLVALNTGVCPPKMRFVLLEREGVENNKGDSNMREKALTNPMWYERMLAVHSHDDIRAMRYTAGGNTGFLELPTLSDDAFKQIITDYAEAANKRLSERDQEEILDYCKTIEQNGQGVSRPRPLILLFIVDAWEQEGEHRRWNIQELLLRIIGRYKEHWKTTLCAGDQSVFLAVQRLLIYATATGGWKTKDPLPEYLQKDYLAVENYCVTQNKLKQLFMSVNEKSSWDGILSPLEPDLIGELFVLDYLQNTTEYQEMITAFNANSRYLLFILRSIVDYADVDEYADLFGNGLKGVLEESLIKESPEFYALLLRLLIGKQNKDNASDTLAYLESFTLNSQYADNEAIVLVYARGLVNLASDQEVTEAEKTVEKLRNLASDSRYVGNEEIVLRYARGLVNLAYNQEITEAEKTVERLEELASDSRYVGNEEIVLRYARGLVNLACDQEVAEAEKTVEKLRELARDSRYVGNEKFVLAYAEGLVNLAGNQEVTEAEKTIEKLEELAGDSCYVGNEKFVLAYAKGLVNLAGNQEVTEAEKTVERLEELARDSRYVGNEEFMLMYAKGLVNLAYNQEVTETEKTVERLEELASDSRYMGNEEIVQAYALGLFDLAVKQEVTEAEKTVERLEELASDSRYVGNEEIVLEYAEGLAILGYEHYLQLNYDKAEKNFSKAYQMGCKDVSVILCYMIRRRETKMYSPPAIKEILLPVLNDKNPLAIMNMALYLAEYENDWQGADDMIFDSAETADFSAVIEWWSSLDDLEGLLVMTWLERNKICMPQYTLKAKDTLELLRSKYPQVPDWMTEIRE